MASRFFAFLSNKVSPKNQRGSAMKMFIGALTVALLAISYLG
jgi:hypothetical protein